MLVSAGVGKLDEACGDRVCVCVFGGVVVNVLVPPDLMSFTFDPSDCQCCRHVFPSTISGYTK